jgi:hypothetical protein
MQRDIAYFAMSRGKKGNRKGCPYQNNKFNVQPQTIGVKQ